MQCDLCAFNGEYLLGHLRKHIRNNEIIKCICGKTFAILSTFKSHCRPNHQDKASDEDSTAFTVANDENGSPNDSNPYENNSILTPISMPESVPKTPNLTSINEPNDVEFEETQKKMASFFISLKNKFCLTDQVIQFFVDEMTDQLGRLKEKIDEIVPRNYEKLAS
jgi:hypothetical protein